jgi:hypothetical protein
MTITDELPISGFQDLLNDDSCRLEVLHHSAFLAYFKAQGQNIT